jgi:molybdopterin converting factor small subunit
MATVCVTGPLRHLAGDRSEHDVDAGNVAEVLHGLEARYPRIEGWILDERGLIRRHILVFVNGERVNERDEIGPTDRVEVLPAISGGDA